MSGFGSMNAVADAAKDIARVATGVGIVAVESCRGLRFEDLGSFASQMLKYFSRSDTHVGNFASAEAEFQELRESQGRQRRGLAMDSNVVELQDVKTTEAQSGSAQADVPQPEDLFAPKKAAESKERRPFKSVEADAEVEPLSQKVALPSVDAHPPTK